MCGGVHTKVCTKPGKQLTLGERRVSLQSLGVGRNPLKAGVILSQYVGTLAERRDVGNVTGAVPGPAANFTVS